MISFTADYYIAVLISTAGVLQFAFSLADLKGLLFLKSPFAARTLGLVTAAFGLTLFFITDSRNVNDYEGGLDAPDQALFFSLGAISAFVVTLCVSSLINLRMKSTEFDPNAGLEALRDSNYAVELTRSVAYWCSNWRTLTKRYFFG